MASLQKMKLQLIIVVIFAIIHIAAGDLIGWNRGRNTAHKHMLVRNKIGNSQIIDQYLQFYNNRNKLQKLQAAIKKNIRTRRDQWTMLFNRFNLFGIKVHEFKKPLRLKKLVIFWWLF